MIAALTAASTSVVPYGTSNAVGSTVIPVSSASGAGSYVRAISAVLSLNVTIAFAPSALRATVQTSLAESIVPSENVAVTSVIAALTVSRASAPYGTSNVAGSTVISVRTTGRVSILSQLAHTLVSSPSESSVGAVVVSHSPQL